MRTTTGRNLDKLWKTGIELDLINHSDSATDINLKIFNKKHQFAVTPYGEEYRLGICLLYTSPSPRDQRGSRMPSSA